MIVEPLVQGAAGMWTHPPAYLRALHALARRHGALFIADEVATGFGRTGRLFACEHAGISPDILCVAKGISGGYLPLAATLATEDVFAAFLARYEEYRAFFHGHTSGSGVTRFAASPRSAGAHRPAAWRVQMGFRSLIPPQAGRLDLLLDAPQRDANPARLDGGMTWPVTGTAAPGVL